MGAGHSHALPTTQNERLLWIALGLTTTFLVAEFVAGLLTNSLALISDAAHMFTDSAALAIALAAVRVARRPADKLRTFGYHRFEILAAAFNAILLFLVALYILYEAYFRFRDPPEIGSMGMLIVAVVGLVINLISMRLLSGGKDSSLNVKGAYLEVWSDMIGSIGVIIAAIIIRFTGWAWVDSLVAAGIGFWVLPRTWTLLKESTNILLQGVPKGIDIAQIESVIRATLGVTDVHDLHVWAITSGRNILSAHLIIDPKLTSERDAMKTVTDLISNKFGISESTVQVELVGEDLHPESSDHNHDHEHDQHMRPDRAK